MARTLAAGAVDAEGADGTGPVGAELGEDIEAAGAVGVEDEGGGWDVAGAGSGVHAFEEADEGVADGVIRGEELGVVVLDGGEDGDAWVVVEEVVLPLVGLVDEVGAVAEVGVEVPVLHGGANLDGGVEPAGDGEGAEHGGGGAFAVDAGDGDGDALAHEGAEQRLPADDGDAALAGGDELGQVGVAMDQEGRDDDEVDAVGMRDVVSEGDGRAVAG